MNLKKYQPYDAVKLCKNNLCIEARGQNAKALTITLCVVLIVMALATVIRVSR